MIYGLKQVSRQWYIEFDKVITRNGFKENVVDRCIYMKVSTGSFIFLVLHVYDILLATHDIDFLLCLDPTSYQIAQWIKLKF